MKGLYTIILHGMPFPRIKTHKKRYGFLVVNGKCPQNSAKVVNTSDQAVKIGAIF